MIEVCFCEKAHFYFIGVFGGDFLAQGAVI